jgi:hypothetical protein
MELWRVMCRIIGFHYNQPNKSRYTAVSWEARLMPVAAHSILFALLLREALKPRQGIFGAKLTELWRVMCGSTGVYYN